MYLCVDILFRIFEMYEGVNNVAKVVGECLKRSPSMLMC
jgi:hypothetical protein